MKPPVARKLAVMHTSFVCLTASFVASGDFKLIISKCMHCLQACILNTLLLLHSHLSQHGEDTAKRGNWRHALKSHGNYIVGLENHGKIMELCF